MGPICRWWYVSVVPMSFPVFLLATLLCSNRFLPRHIFRYSGSYAHHCLMLLLLFAMPPPLALPALFFAWWTLILLSRVSANAICSVKASVSHAGTGIPVPPPH